MDALKTTPVQFRILKGEVIAVFPYYIEGVNCVTCYSHVGQHSACKWNINTFTKPAKPDQYEPLLAELKSVGYDNIAILKRRNHKTYLAWYKDWLSFTD